MMNFKRRAGIVAAGLVVLLFSAVAAYAFWTAGGSGTGTATTGTNSTVTAVQTSTTTGLAPGVAPSTLAGNFTNSNSSAVYVSTVTASIGSVTKAAGAVAGTCDATDYTLANAVMTVNSSIPAGTAQGAWTGATIGFNNKATNQDACKGATVNLVYTIA